MDRQLEFQQAVHAWEQAWRQFEQADAEALDYTVYQLQAAEEKMAMIWRQARAHREEPLVSHLPPAVTSAPLDEP